MILCRHASARVDNEDHDIGLGYGLSCLPRHFMKDATGGIWLEATGIDDDVLMLSGFADAVMPIAGKTREVGNDGVSRLRETIEQS